MKKLVISRRDLDMIRKEMEASAPYEACGVLVGTIKGATFHVERTVPVRNASGSKLGFVLDQDEFYNAWMNAEKNGKTIVGIYHTHPIAPAVLSKGDKKSMENFPSVWLVAGIDRIRAYIWDNGEKPVKTTEY